MQTPKEKALELVGNFENVELLKDVGGMDIELARQCALVSANQLKTETYDIYISTIGNECAEERFKFWHSVVQEIEKL